MIHIVGDTAPTPPQCTAPQWAVTMNAIYNEESVSGIEVASYNSLNNFGHVRP